MAAHDFVTAAHYNIGHWPIAVQWEWVVLYALAVAAPLFEAATCAGFLLSKIVARPCVATVLGAIALAVGTCVVEVMNRFALDEFGICVVSWNLVEQVAYAHAFAGAVCAGISVALLVCVGLLGALLALAVQLIDLLL